VSQDKSPRIHLTFTRGDGQRRARASCWRLRSAVQRDVALVAWQLREFSLACFSCPFSSCLALAGRVPFLNSSQTFPRDHTMFYRLVFLTLLACFAADLLSAAEPTADEKGVKAAVESYVKAFNKADADAVANHWAEDAEYQLPTGDRVHGRAAIRETFAKMFAGDNPPKIEVVKARIRIVTKDVAIEEGEVRVQSGDEAPEDSTYVAVHVRKGKEWKLNTVREVASPAPEPAAEHPLQDLEWLVGTWQENSKSGAHSRFAWSKLVASSSNQEPSSASTNTAWL